MNDGTIDLTGQRFGRLVVISKIYKPEGATQTGSWWLCQCDCGQQKKISSRNLRWGNTKSCGCLKAEVNRAMHGKRSEKGCTSST